MARATGGRSKRAARSAQLALLLGSSLVSLAALEVLVRVFVPAPGLIPFPVAETRGVMQPDPVRGYRYASGYSRRVVTDDYTIDFETNSLGLRDVEPDRVAADRVPILVVGDSYTQGHGVEAVEAWPKQIEQRRPAFHFWNAGVSGYGLEQMRRTAEQLRERLAPRALLVGVYGHGYSRVRDPFVVVGGDAGIMRRSVSEGVTVTPDGYLLPVFGRPGLKPAGLWVDQHFQVLGHLLHLALGPRTLGLRPALPDGVPDREDLARDMQPMLDELAALDAQARAWELPMAALLIGPVQPDGSIAPIQRLVDEIVVGFARERRICLIDPTPALEASGIGKGLRLGGDPHWSATAHRIAAEAFLAALDRAPDDVCGPVAGMLRR